MNINEINVLGKLPNKTDNVPSRINFLKRSFQHKTNNGVCRNVRYPRVGVKRLWQVYVTSELKIKLFCLFTFHNVVWIFIGVGKRYLCFSYTKILNSSKRSKLKQNEEMKPKTSNEQFTTSCLLLCSQPGKFWQARY